MGAGYLSPLYFGLTLLSALRKKINHDEPTSDECSRAEMDNHQALIGLGLAWLAVSQQL